MIHRGDGRVRPRPLSGASAGRAAGHRRQGLLGTVGAVRVRKAVLLGCPECNVIGAHLRGARGRPGLWQEAIAAGLGH